MPTNSSHTAALDFLIGAEQCYAALMQTAPPATETSDENSFGGCLFYAGEFNEQGRAMVVAGNVAGAATLTATADIPAQKQAIRLGIVDFLVTSLDESLRILKNEIRKRNTVAVCVAAAPEAVECEMLERGVVPDLLRSHSDAGAAVAKFGSRAKPISPASARESFPLLIWQASGTPARSMPRLDALALDCLPPEEVAARRWARLAPRYCGRLAESIRVLRCDQNIARRFAERVQAAIATGEVAGVEVRIRTALGDQVLVEAS